jgi:hypothetical protein
VSVVTVPPINSGVAKRAEVVAAINSIANEFNGSIDDANIKSNAAINPTKIAGGVAGMFGAWPSWSPTWANLTLGNAVQAFEYIQVGKTVLYRGYITLGSTSAVGTGPTFTLPVNAKDTGKGTASGAPEIGLVYMERNSVANFQGLITLASVSTGALSVFNVSGTYLTLSAVTASVPFAFAAGDEIRIRGFYEAG